MEPAQGMRIKSDLSVSLGQAIASSLGLQFSGREPTVTGKIMFDTTAIRAQVVAAPIVEVGMAITLRPFTTGADVLSAPRLLHGTLMDLDHRKREFSKEVRARRCESKGRWEDAALGPLPLSVPTIELAAARCVACPRGCI